MGTYYEQIKKTILLLKVDVYIFFLVRSIEDLIPFSGRYRTTISLMEKATEQLKDGLRKQPFPVVVKSDLP